MGSEPTALITGAAKRIGRAIALDLAHAGWRICVHYNSSGQDAARTVAEIENTGGKAIALKADLTDVTSTQELIPRCCEELGVPTCLINNASLFEHDEISTLTVESFQRHLDVNLNAPVLLAQDFAKHLPDDMSGVIVNILDQRVWKLTPEYFSYTLSKSALWAATRTLAQGLAPRIRVNAIGPGPALANARQTKEGFARQQASTILERGPEPEEICAAVRFVLDARSMTGQMIALDGGQHLAWRTPDIYESDQ